MCFVRTNEIACIPPTETGLGQIAAVIGQIASAAIQTGGVIGSALISADANKYVIKQQTKTDLQISLARQEAELKAYQAQFEAQKLAQEQETIRTNQVATATKDTLIELAPFLGLGLLALGAAMVIKRNGQPAQHGWR